MRFEGQKVLVTGASGFIGGRLCRRLFSLGAEVHAISRRTREDPGCPELRWWQGDMAEPRDVREIVATVQPEIIYHFAGDSHAARGEENVFPTFHSNLLTTVNLLLAARECNCRRLLLAGSLEEPDDASPGFVPSSPYAASKWASSVYARMFYALYALDVVILRIFMVYGPGQADVGKLIPFVTLSLLRGETPRLSSGRRPVDWIHVDDVVDGAIAAAHAQGIGGRTIDIGSGQLVTVRKMLEQLAPFVDSGATLLFDALPDRPFEQVRLADIAQTKASIQWQPVISLSDGLRQTVEWYRKNL